MGAVVVGYYRGEDLICVARVRNGVVPASRRQIFARLRLFVSTGPDELGHFELVVPSKPFKLQVTASGYRIYEHVGAILVERASTKELRVRLQRSESPTPN